VSVLEERLLALGFGAAAWPDMGDWRVERLDAVAGGATGADQPRLVGDRSAWRDLLRDPPGPPIYRIRRSS
jgi:hypothetical protein